MMHSWLVRIIYLCLLSAQVLAQPADRINWPIFLRRHNMVWDSITTDYYKGAPLGNGLLGAMIYREDVNSLRWDMGRTDVTDHRPLADPLFAQPRLPIGRFVFHPNGTIQSARMKLNLWNAEATGTLQTSKGSITWRSFVHAEQNLIVVELATTGTETATNWQFIPALSQSSRSVRGVPKGYEPNPPAILKTDGITTRCRQTLLAGGEYVTAWRQQLVGNRSTLFISISGVSNQADANAQVTYALKRAALQSITQQMATHRNWWHHYYPASFLSVPDTRLEGFYWIQQYKLGSAMRADKPLTDLMGPWYYPSVWPAIWWNLNVQLTYYPLYTANRLGLAESLVRTLNTNETNLINNVPAAYRYNSAALGRISSYDCRSPVDIENAKSESGREAGDLTWILHNYYLHGRYSMNKSLMVRQFYPLLRRSINYYRHLLKEGDDGALHLPPTLSPEYGLAPDCNYDLSLLRWGCQTLLDINRQYRLNDSLQIVWQTTLTRLTPNPVDANGYMIGRGVPFAKSHRHFSHLFLIYPLHLLDPEPPENRALIERSLVHWLSFKEALQGYTFTGAASIAALMGQGTRAAGYLNQLIDRFIQPNTFYKEAGPVIETPLSGANALQEMLLQSWGNWIRVFPAVPDEWADVTFRSLRTEGAFLVSGVWKGGYTRWVRVESLAGQPCRVQTPIKQGFIRVAGRPPVAFTAPDGRIDVPLKKGETALIYSSKSVLYRLEPVRANPQFTSSFGWNLLSRQHLGATK